MSREKRRCRIRMEGSNGVEVSTLGYLGYEDFQFFTKLANLKEDSNTDI